MGISLRFASLVLAISLCPAAETLTVTYDTSYIGKACRAKESPETKWYRCLRNAPTKFIICPLENAPREADSYISIWTVYDCPKFVKFPTILRTRVDMSAESVVAYLARAVPQYPQSSIVTGLRRVPSTLQKCRQRGNRN